MSRAARIEGQLHLDVPAGEPRVGLVHVLRPDYLGLEAEHFADISDQMIRLAGPKLLRPSLIDVQPDSPSAVGYQPALQADNRMRFIAVTPADYEILDRSPTAVRRHGYNKTLKARGRDPEAELAANPNLFAMAQAHGDEDFAAAYRAGAHFNERLEKDMRRHVALTITPRLELIEKFSEASRHPNLQRIGSQRAMRVDFRNLTSNVIGEMLLAVRSQRGWTDAQTDLASRAIVKAIVFAERPGVRAQRFGALMALAGEWYGNKNALFLDRIHQAGRTALQAYRESEKYAPKPA